MGDSKKDIPATSAPPKIVELVPGQIVSGRYKIRRRIGQGGMGAVYAAGYSCWRWVPTYYGVQRLWVCNYPYDYGYYGYGYY